MTSTFAGLVLDVDATIVVCHAEKQSTAKTRKKNWGYHSLLYGGESKNASSSL